MSRATPVELTAERLREMPLPQPEAGSKDDRGRILVVAGSAEVPGAALLAGIAALRAGAGKLKIATVRSAAIPLAITVPEAMVLGLDETPEGGIAADAALARLKEAVERADCVLIGPGMTEGPDTIALTRGLCGGTVPFVLDAATLCGLGEEADVIRACDGRVVATPHAGEMARLLDTPRETIEADPLAAGIEAAALLRAVVVVKGAQSHIVAPDGRAWIFTGGNAGLATSGSGDVLAGIVAGLVARGADPVQATLWGVYLHGEAGARLARRCGPIGYLARELPGEIPGLLRDLA